MTSPLLSREQLVGRLLTDDSLLREELIRRQLFTITDAVRDLFGAWFSEEATWRAWMTFLRVIFALPLSAEELALYTACTGRNQPPESPSMEAWLVVGRRGGKSFIVALIAVYLAALRDYSQYLAPGERGTVMVIAADRKQARVILRYVKALLGVPLLAGKIEREIADGVELSTRVNIEIHTASFRAVRGYTVVAALLDEIAFWRTDDAANPDREVIEALRPAMTTIPGAMLLGLSSPYAKRGVLWDTYRAHYGREGSPAMIWQADSLTMHPSLPRAVIDDAYERDPISAAAEYGAQFRSDVAVFLPREVVDGAVMAGVTALPPEPRKQYTAFVDPSGGSVDSFSLGIACAEGDKAVLACLYERRPPFSPAAVVEELVALLKQYRVTEVTGDRYGGEFPRELFAKRGIKYKLSEHTRSDLYLELLPLLTSGRVALLDQPRLLNQLSNLERRTTRNGKDGVDHSPGAHDDLANSAAGAIVNAVVGVRIPHVPVAPFSMTGRSNWRM